MSVMTDKSSPQPPIAGHLANYPTPLHIFYENYLLADARELEEGLNSTLPGAELYYSTKTNSLLPLLQALVKLDWGLEVVGPHDRAQASKAGVAGEKILLNGPAWTKATLEDALFHQGVKNLTIDSSSMAELLGSVLNSRSVIPKLNIALRLYDGSSHFGFHPHKDHFERAWNFLPKNSIESLGFHIHTNPAGSIRSLTELTADFRNRCQKVNSALRCLEGTTWKSLIQFVDLGGGIDSPFVYRPHPAELSEFHTPVTAPAFRERNSAVRFSLREAGSELGKAVRAELGAFWEGKQILFEPGRSVCTRALSTLVEVRSVKRTFYPDAEVIFTDGNTAILGPLHRGVHGIFPVAIRSEATVPTFVYGNLPHSGDWLFQNIQLPPLNIGDRLLLAHTGAYFQPLEAAFGHVKPIVVRSDRNEVIS